MEGLAQRKPFWKLVKKVLTAPFCLLAAIIIIFEDWLWDDLARIAAFFGQLPILRTIEALITSLPPYLSLIVFAVPSLLLIPVKLLAVYFVAHGQATMGLVTVIAAKVIGTAVIARLFTITRPKLLRIPWFVWLHDRVVAFKTRIYSYLHATAIYRTVHEYRLRLRNTIRAWMLSRRSSFRRRWQAVVRWTRRKRHKAA